MKKWFSQVTAQDTKIWVSLYLVVSLVGLVFGAFIMVPAVIKTAPAMVRWVTFWSGSVGIVIGLFVATYFGYLLYWIARKILKQEPVDKVLVKRSFYLTTSINGVVVGLVQLLLTVFGVAVDNKIMLVVAGLLGACFSAWLIAEFFKQLLKRAQLGQLVAGMVLVLRLLPIAWQLWRG
ncbi:hypothetical protein [Latilactobacillus fuchuensis]|uniref:hypothetical protein n=1 Tax=Latilactobacillus fuchuensis TaxID=164393 RepID=UPI0020C766A9|nr:hypothetical protein [Latilactobacillus fuchuensis]MCP8857041.1 hypothetical protein [Latilactobacillus fuchuensis]